MLENYILRLTLNSKYPSAEIINSIRIKSSFYYDDLMNDLRHELYCKM